MELLKKIANNFIALDTKEILFRTVSNNPQLEKLAIKLNQEKQLKLGLTADNGFLGDYSTSSVRDYGKDPGPIQLYETGAFYKSFQVILLDDGFLIDADAMKTDDSGATTNLFTEYGQDITGLNDENLTIFINALRPKITEAIIRRIFL
jgi:hypothetical protein